MPPRIEMTLETAPSLPCRGKSKSPLRLKLEAMQPGQVLRIRGPVSRSAVTCACQALRPAVFRVMKVNGGFDTFRLA